VQLARAGRVTEAKPVFRAGLAVAAHHVDLLNNKRQDGQRHFHN
jgi:hypothetical protein